MDRERGGIQLGVGGSVGIDPLLVVEGVDGQ